MSFTYIRDIPFPSHNPSQDAPNMLTNTNSSDDIWAADHINFNSTNSGKHKQVSFITQNSAGAQTDPASTLFTGVGTASTVAEMFYRNQNATLLISCIKAFGNFTSGLGPVTTFNNQYNCASISGSGTSYIITLNPNVVTGSAVVGLVLADAASGSIAWTFVNPTLTISNVIVGTKVSFVIIQA